MNLSTDKKVKRMAVFIDGRNVFYRLQKLGWPTQYDVRAFAEGISSRFHLVSVHYYNATPLLKYTPEPYYGQQLRYYEHIRTQPNVTVKLGYLNDRGPKPQEKLVDVMLALDLALGAARDLYDVAALVSADGDFAAAVEEAKAAGKEVINFVFAIKRSFHLAACCDEVRTLKSKHFSHVSC
jgi:uncharacterized LabA/DUF88 family protein